MTPVTAAPLVVLTTGGTIASRDDGTATLRSGVTPVPGGVRTRELFSLDSSALTLVELDVVRRAVAEELAGGASAVVLTHGTDTLEETALLLDVLHDDARPVVLTGAMRPADDPAPDGPANLRDALAVAADTGARGLGVLVVLGGVVHAARGVRKAHTSTPAPFDDPDHGPVGTVRAGRVHLHRTPRRPAVLPVPERLDARVDVVALYPGADGTAVRAHVVAGARGLVLATTGSGNTHPSVVAAVALAVAAGVQVVVSTRVAAGPVTATYGGGGGAVDLLAAGAVLAPNLRPGQARVQLAVLLAGGAAARAVRHADW